MDLDVPADAQGRRRISPTDVAQFIRLEQCRRYLRLRLHERVAGPRFLADYGVAPQAIPPLLTRSGATFEQQVERAVAAAFPTVDCAEAYVGKGNRPDDNMRVAAVARDLPPGATMVLFQPRIEVDLAGWRLRGDVDVLRLQRDAGGALHVLIADMKSSTSAKVEHRLQVAFYCAMLGALFEREGIDHDEIAMGILYRGPAEQPLESGAAQAALWEQQYLAAERYFGARSGLLEIVAEPGGYHAAVRDLVTGTASTAAAVATAPFEEIPYHLTYKCDGCLYNEFCMRWSAEHDDLSLLPHLAEQDKSALQRSGIMTVRELAQMKQPREAEGTIDRTTLVPAPGQADVVRALAATPPIGPRLDELAQRARRYRAWKGDALDYLTYIPHKGYGSLPYCDAAHNPNLVRVYVDAQHDYLHDRLYMLGALVVASAGGEPSGRRPVVHMTERSPETAEQEETLLRRWIDETIAAIVHLAAPDEEGQPRAPIHLIFFDTFAQRLLLQGLGRHATRLLGATPLYDFVTQLAAFDSPVVTYLDAEIRELKNYPMVCQSLQAVAAYLRFDWNTPQPYREVFRTRLFDAWGKLEERQSDAAGDSPWYTRRARFTSQIPLEYAYAAWGELAAPPAAGRDELAPYRAATPALLRGFHARRLEALEHIAADFKGNERTEKRLFDLPDLDAFVDKAPTLAQALDEFVTIERHVELSDWKAARLAPPERRVLSGVTLLACYLDADQDAQIAARNAENAARRRLKEQYYAAYRAAHPGSKRVMLPKEQREEVTWDQKGMRVRLRLDCAGVDCDLAEALSLSTLRPGDRVVLYTRRVVDTRLPVAERVEFTPTPRQLLYGIRATIVGIVPNGDASRPPYVEVEMAGPLRGTDSRGFQFGSIVDEPLVDGMLYTLDSEPNNAYGGLCARVVEGLCSGEPNTLYERIADPASARVAWPAEAAAGQARFLAGLDALLPDGERFEQSKRDYIGACGDAPMLLVQGPPGTGKSYATAYALFARLQGAMAAGREYRAVVSCKTHAAIDVLLHKALAVQQQLRWWATTQPDLFAAYIDPRLLDVPLFRVRPRSEQPEGIITLPKDEQREPGAPRAIERVTAEPWCVVAAGPAGVRGMIHDCWPKELCGHHFCDALILDEASQMNLPEAMMAALALKRDGHVIVVGDHRQMPPIVKHAWHTEPRRTFQQYRSYESLFLTLLPLQPRLIQFEESFRLHRDMAEFLRQEIYRHDGINYYSRRDETLGARGHSDPFVASVLAPEHPLVVVVHDEDASQVRNLFERDLVGPVLAALADPLRYNLGLERGFGVVVPHRAQRAALQDAVPLLTMRDPVTGAVIRSAVDTVEKFQGDEREAILVSATESDPEYLLLSSEFLLDPRRLTVALSRARCKMVLVASRAVFTLFSADEETFANAQLWKNLLHRACTVPLWSGEREGRQVEVWGNK